MKALGIAATGMLAQQTNVDVIANNIANANTTGFKSGRAAFQDLVYQSFSSAGSLTSESGTARPVGTDIGLGVQAAGVIRHNAQGGLIQTENQLDLAIEGRGYFVINRPDGSQAFTRDGNFELSAQGQLVTLNGYEVEPAIVVPDLTRQVEINQFGVVMAYVENDPNPVELGQLNFATFLNEAGLKPVGDNLMEQTSASGEAVQLTPGTPGVGITRQGYLEQSNVNIIQQITDLISAQRAYEMNSKAIETADQIMTTTNQIK
ncbi:MAG TPA: flagellar basal-body rod protein FlgG [Roseobacter sp.]|uniref:Flagellar basal-body rod protein FlgG n=1 Tax=marine sediment metagenome TaxID=412755 RepID=A0A0F9T8Z8_9ZZZZ|nr:flagellar basal-body rod protein FlgG [Roseobacter sp.]|tara:strand:+ start:7360 stop:8145 length:786 start_codon:yes stop_codon:yes gene_type:complete